MTYKNKAVLALILLFMLSCVIAPFYAEADNDLPMAKTRDQMVRVHLTRLGLTDRLHITLLSPYEMTTDDNSSFLFSQGSEIAFLLRNDLIYVHYQDMSFCAGKQLHLRRTSPGTDNQAGFVRTNFPAMYMGDLQLDANEGKLRPVLKIHVEDYLLGVVPYEMSETFPLEALKAQAIAARTYALRKQNSDQPYDLVDTTNDQVYKGYLPGNPRTEQAVAETRGECGFYKGNLAQCYYSASNGGQMELVETVWPTNEDFGYYAFAADPYDVANPASTVRSFELQKEYQSASPLALRELVVQQFSSLLESQGFDPSAESVHINRILSVSAESPVSADSLLMTTLRLEMEICGRTRSEVLPLTDTDPEEVSLFSSVSQNPVTVSPAPVQTPAAPKIVYGPYTPISESVVLEIPIFPTAEKIFSMDISTNFENEIWSVVNTETSFVLEARRYGHGVGMSQRGAQWMALTHEKSYRDILSFYYPGMELKRYPEQNNLFVFPADALTEEAGPAPSPTPRPTLMPVSLIPQDGQWLASVTEISEDSSLNLRAEPNLNATIVMRLYKNQKLLVTERCSEEGWVKVRTNVTEGYVMEKYLSSENP